MLPFFYCCSIIVVLNAPLCSPLPPLLHPCSHSQSPPCCPCPWVLYPCLLTLPFFPVIPSPLSLSALYFHVSGSVPLFVLILLTPRQRVISSNLSMCELLLHLKLVHLVSLDVCWCLWFCQMMFLSPWLFLDSLGIGHPGPL